MEAVQQYPEQLYFNSQPHEEADMESLGNRYGKFYFNSQPHEEADSNSAQKFLVQNCFFCNYYIYCFLCSSLIQFFAYFFFLNLSFCRCECSRESCVLNFRTYNIKVSVTSKPGLAPICSTLFLYFSPR